MIDLVLVGRKIHELRQKKDMSQDELAEMLCVTRQALSRWETGTSFPTIDTLIELIKIFDVSFEEILCLEEETTIYHPDDLFQGHNRLATINRILEGNLVVDLPEVFYQFAPMERMMILKAIKEKTLTCDQNDLWVRLTIAEQRYLGGNNDEIRKENN